MIISASRRTDLPRYFAPWFIGRVRAGYALTKNPFNNAQLRRVPLTADEVDCIVFWSKDPAPLMPYLGEIEKAGLSFYFQFTLTPYGENLEPGLRPKAEIERTFIALSSRLGRKEVVWRYDPVLLGENIGVDFHRAEFERLCSILAPYADTAVISFVDMYSKLKTPLFRAPTEGEADELAGFFGETAKKYGITPTACCEDGRLARFGIARAACVDLSRVREVSGKSELTVPPDKNQRPGCGCAASVDIGAYNTCPALCAYCYANGKAETVKRRYASHDPEGESIIK